MTLQYKYNIRTLPGNVKVIFTLLETGNKIKRSPDVVSCFITYFIEITPNLHV